MSDEHRSRVIQVSNLAPSATRDHMKTLFSYLGRTEEIKIYPEIDTGSTKPKVCYVKFSSSTDAGAALHLSNTVFVDRALIIVRVDDGKIPDESVAMRVAAPGSTIPGQLPPNNNWPATVINQLSGVGSAQIINTIDPKFSQLVVPTYPPLPAVTDSIALDEIRRTIHVTNLDMLVSPSTLLDFFGQAGEVKYLRMTGDDVSPTRGALIEFTYQASVGPGLAYNGTILNGNVLTIGHATGPIAKPQPASTPQVNSREIEEALKKVKDAQSLISAAVDTGDSKNSRRRRSRSPSRHSSRRSRSPRRSLSRKRSRSRSRRRSRSRNGGDTDHPKTTHLKQEVAKPDSKRSRRKRSRSRHRSRSPRPRRSRSPRRRRSRSRSRGGGEAHHSKADRQQVARQDITRDRRRRRSRSPRFRGRRSTSRGRRSRSISRGKDRRRSRSRSRERKKNRRTRSKSRSPKPRKERSPSSDRDDSKSKEKDKKASSRRRRSRSTSRTPPLRYRRSRSRGRKSKSRSRSPRKSSRKKKDRMSSLSPSPDRSSKRKTKDKERDRDRDREESASSKIRRDYDEEEKGFDKSDEDAPRRRERSNSSSDDDDPPPPPTFKPEERPPPPPPIPQPRPTDDSNTTQMDMETDSD